MNYRTEELQNNISEGSDYPMQLYINRFTSVCNKQEKLNLFHGMLSNLFLLWHLKNILIKYLYIISLSCVLTQYLAPKPQNEPRSH